MLLTYPNDVNKFCEVSSSTLVARRYSAIYTRRAALYVFSKKL